jgi:hypothetical protein
MPLKGKKFIAASLTIALPSGCSREMEAYRPKRRSMRRFTEEMFFLTRWLQAQADICYNERASRSSKIILLPGDPLQHGR